MHRLIPRATRLIPRIGLSTEASGIPVKWKRYVFAGIMAGIPLGAGLASAATVGLGIHRLESLDKKCALGEGLSLQKVTDFAAGLVIAPPESLSWSFPDVSYTCTVVWAMQKSEERRNREYTGRYG